MDEDLVFRALADTTRRRLLDLLFEHNGMTLSELCASVAATPQSSPDVASPHPVMTRQAVSKHLAILEAANLVVTRRQGRDKIHSLNPVPIHEIADRWIAKYQRLHLAALHHLKTTLEAPRFDLGEPKSKSKEK
jgi:DNA-binding transcriptional ArsR family regulator